MAATIYHFVHGWRCDVRMRHWHDSWTLQWPHIVREQWTWCKGLCYFSSNTDWTNTWQKWTASELCLGEVIQILKEKNPRLKIINLGMNVGYNKWNAMAYEGNPLSHASKKCKCHSVSWYWLFHPCKQSCCRWGFPGLIETMDTLHDAGIKFAGAGCNSSEATSPAVFQLEDDTRALVFSAGHYSSGVPDSWQAKPDREGVNILEFYQASKAVAQLKE